MPVPDDDTLEQILGLVPRPGEPFDPAILTYTPTPDSVKPTVHSVLAQLGNVVSVQGRDAWWIKWVHKIIHRTWGGTPDAEQRARLAMLSAYLILHTFFNRHPRLYEQLKIDAQRAGLIQIQPPGYSPPYHPPRKP